MNIDQQQDLGKARVGEEVVIHLEDLPVLVSEMLQNTYSTSEILTIFQQFPLESLVARPDVLARCVTAVKETAMYHVDSETFDKPMIAIFGTGGDGQDTVNISTLAGLAIAASKRCVVAKYGNGSASGKMGTMDTLQESDVAIDLSYTQVIDQIRRAGMAPVFARNVYPGARFVAEARSLYRDGEGKPAPTIFNLIMPLAVN